MNWQYELDQVIDELYPRMVEVRRHLHMNPEVSGHERGTSLFLYQLLGDERLDVRMGPEGRGVLVDLPSHAEHCRRLALRGDIDALRIHDQKQVPYRSQCEGVMHACGHDAHTALIWGTTLAVARMSQAGQLPWDVSLRGIFQPAEETCEGAKAMISVGALDDVDAILAAHVDPTRCVGQIGLRAGVLTANCDEMQITVAGRGGHAARPHEAADPIVAAAQLINAIYTFVPRVTDSQDAVVVTIGQIVGGDTANVIPEQVRLRGTIRTLDRRVREQTLKHIGRLIEGIAQASDTSIRIEYGLASNSVVNSEEMIRLLSEAADSVIGQQGIQTIARPSMGSEDFAFYLDHVPGAMIRLGCSSAESGNASLHSPRFDIDEQALRIGARILARAAVLYFRPTNGSPAAARVPSSTVGEN